MAETLSSLNLTTGQCHTFLQRGQDVALLILCIVIVNRFAVNLEETVELDNLSLSHELLVSATDRNIDSRLLYLCISHLTGDGTLPDELIELALLSCTLNLCTVHIGRTDGFVSFLSTLGTGVVLAHLAVFLAVELGNLLLAGIDTQTREVHRVSTHIGNLSVFIQVLGNHHRLTDGEA